MMLRFKNRWLHVLGTTLHKFWVLFYLGIFAARLIWCGLKHDLSKYGRTESAGFIRVIHKLKTTDYGSEAYKATLEAIRPAIDHHQKTNRHHPEYYLCGIDGMNLVDLVEMICDWLASVRRHNNGRIERSIEVNKERFHMADQLINIISNTVAK